MVRSIGKIIEMGVLVIISLSILASCGSSIKITDFDGLKDLPRDPIRIVFATNSHNFDEKNEVYGDLIEYEVQSANII